MPLNYLNFEKLKSSKAIVKLWVHEVERVLVDSI